MNWRGLVELASKNPHPHVRQVDAFIQTANSHHPIKTVVPSPPQNIFTLAGLFPAGESADPQIVLHANEPRHGINLAQFLLGGRIVGGSITAVKDGLSWRLTGTRRTV